MAVGLEQPTAASGDHVVHFYADDYELTATVGPYLTGAAEAGAVAIVIATDGHRRAFAAELEAAGVDVAQGRRDGTLILLDAAATMASFMLDGRIDGDRFHEVVGSVVRRAVATGRPVRAYGEMVALLWEAGDVPAVIELETLWNALGRELRFSLVCGYRSESVQGDGHAEALQHVCQLHSAVLPRVINEDIDAWLPVNTEVSAEFAAETNAPRSARHFVTATLRSWGHNGMLVDDAGLLVTELATNAVLHARSPFRVVARTSERGVRVSVHDASHVRPTRRTTALTATSGRGLQLVAALCTDWGVETTSDGKMVWADLEP
jgi:anti-sigma regulatory factor (Ser/Thr protein kinase)